MKSLLLVLFLVICAYPSFGKDIYDLSKATKLNLSGKKGFDGIKGADAPFIDCDQFEGAINGIPGGDGSNGEVGEKGEDAYAYIDDINELSNLTLNQSGGIGGNGGAGGKGSLGCNGGVKGRNGRDGSKGDEGKFGKFYLLPSEFEIPKTNAIRILSLSQLENEGIVLSENTWFSQNGLEKLLNPKSIVRDEYYTFNKTVSYRVELVWDTNQIISDFGDTKFALSLKNGKLDLKSYTGGFLEYSIKKSEQSFFVIIHKVIAEHTVQNLKLKRLKYSGIDLTLEVKQKFDPNVAVKTRFVVSIEKLSNGAESEKTGFIEIPDTLVTKSIDRYFLTIGRLRMPDSFKRKGVKLKILLTVYREVNGQTRARGLDGIFKI